MHRGLLLALGAAMVVGANPSALDAQRPGPNRPGVRAEAGLPGSGPRGLGLEGILRQREALELTQGQVASLEGLRSERLEEQALIREQMSRIRSDMAAGAIEASEARQALHALRDEQHAAGDRMRASVEGILSDAQKETLRQHRQDALQGRRDRMRRGGGAGGQARSGRPFRRPGN